MARRGPDTNTTGSPRTTVGGGRYRSWRLALAGTTLVAVVAIVSRGSLFHDRRHDDGIGRATAYTFAGVMVLMVFCGLVFAALGLRGARIRQPAHRRIWPTLLLTLFVVGAIAAAAPLIRRAAAPRNKSRPVETVTIASSPCPAPCAYPLQSPGSSPWWIVLAAGGLVGALLVVGARASKEDAHDGSPPDLEQARSLFGASLDDLYAEPDARRAIAMAYRRLLDGLASCGLSRAHAETPDEHLARALAELDIAPEALYRLTALFSEARFSDHLLTSMHKGLAIEAFRAARDGLTPHVEHARS